MPKAGGSGHGPMRTVEKSKDFKGSMIRLFKSLGKWQALLIVSLLLAIFSATLSTIAPNKLSSLSELITEGIRPNTKNIEKLSNEIFKNIMINSHMDTSSQKSNNKNNKENQKQYKEFIVNFNKLPDTQKELLLSDIEIDNVKVSKKNQIKYLETLSEMSNTKVTNKFLNKLDSMPKSIKKIITPKMNLKEIKKRALILAIIYLSSSIFMFIQGFIMATIANNFAKNLREKISKKINKLPLRYFDSHETGDILSRVTNDVDSVAQNMNQSFATLVSSLTLFFGSIIMMFITNWIMASTAILASIFGFAFSFVLLKRSQKYFKRRQKELGELNGHIEEIYSGHNVVKAYNGEKSALKEFDKINDRLYDCNRKSQFLSGIMQPIMIFIGNFGYVAVCVVGSLLVMNDKTTFGTIIAFMIYVRLFTSPLSQIAQALTGLQSTAAASERVFEFLDEEELTSEEDKCEVLDIKDAKGNIEFKNVKFGYNQDKLIIKNFSANIKSGQKVAIVGPTGAGKTTMVNLLMKFYDINKGDIIIDGKNAKDLTRENIHDLFVMVLQDTWLFNGSIKDNIKYNKENISDKEIWKACHTVGIDHFIKTLPDDINTQVGDNDSISQGQKQLITIARGMIEKAPFLILDEATSNVDTRTEELVQKAMDKLTEGKTSFIIAHRLSTIKNADLILVMEEGNIIEQGTHDELMKKKGFYEKLYNSQFEKIA